MVRKSRSNAGPEAAIIFAISPLLIMPGMGWCIPCMPLAVGAGTCCLHALSQALMRLISGPWSALIFAARPLTFWECVREAARTTTATATATATATPADQVAAAFREVQRMDEDIWTSCGEWID